MAAVLAVAFALRVWGISFGLPHTLTRPDEEATVATSLRFFGRHLDPQFYHWPSLFMYVVAVAFVLYFNVGRFQGWFPRELTFLTSAASIPGPLFLLARGVSVVAGTITVFLVHRIGEHLFNRRTATVAAFFLAVAALHVRDSHFGVPDVTATCLATGSFLWTCRFAGSGRVRDALYSAGCAGLAMSTKYNLALIAVPALLTIAQGIARPHSAPRQRIVLALAYGLTAAIGFVAATPYALLDWPAFRRGLEEVATHLRTGHIVASGSSWSVQLSSSLGCGLGWPLLGAGLAGMALYCWRDRRLGPVFASFPVLYFAAIGASQTRFARYALPIVPFLVLSAAYLVNDVAGRVSELSGRWVKAGTATALLAAIVAWPSASAAVRTDRLLSRRDTRLLSAEAIARAFPCGATIYQTGFPYGHVQPHAPDAGAAAYVNVEFDAALLPDLIVVQESALAYSRVPEWIPAILSRHYRQIDEQVGTDLSRQPPVYDYDDAFFVPLSGFGAVVRPGPNLRVYARRELTLPQCRSRMSAR